MSELEIYSSLLRTKNGGIFSMNIKNDLYSMRKPKVMLTIINPANEASQGKNRFAKMYLGTEEMIVLIQKLKQGVRLIQSDSEKSELLKIYKGSEDKRKRYGVDIISRAFTVTVDKDRIYFRIELMEGKQLFTKNKFGKSIPGIVKPTGKPAFESVHYALNCDAALTLAYILDKEYTAWRCTLNQDLFINPRKYQYSRPEMEGTGH